MKKLVMTAAVLACAASIVSAQTVTSANIVGYQKESTTNGGFNISSMQFEDGVGTVESIYGDSLPLGSRVYKWTPTGYVISTYAFVPFPPPGANTWSVNHTLNSGESWWVDTPTVSEAVKSGEVPLDATIDVDVPVGFNLVSYPYPVARTVATLGLAPSLGDRVYVWDGSSYVISTYSFVPFPPPGANTWSNPDTPIAVGQGFWVDAVAPLTWTVTKPF